LWYLFEKASVEGKTEGKGAEAVYKGSSQFTVLHQVQVFGKHSSNLVAASLCAFASKVSTHTKHEKKVGYELDKCDWEMRYSSYNIYI